MSYPTFTNSLEFRPSPEFRLYVLEVLPDREPGRMMVETIRRGKAIWREVPKNGPKYRNVIDRNFMDRVAEMELKPEPNYAMLRANGLAADARRKYGIR